VRIRPSPAARTALSALFRSLAPAARRLGLRVFLVGGAVRDLSEGGPPRGEWDLVVLAARPGGAGALAEELARRWRWREPVAFPRFGTYLVEGPAGRVELSDSSLRTRLGLAGSDLLANDARSRDFTLNALYIGPLGDPLGPGSPGRPISVLDPTGRGAADLASGTLRTPIAPARTLADDPLRILRAARLAATRGYRPASSLSRAARECAPLLGKVAAERVREELTRLLTGEHPRRGLLLLGRWGALREVLPEAADMVGYPHDNPAHFNDLFLHVAKAVQAAPPDPVTRWAALLHDCGKPRCRVETPEGCKYYGHEAQGAELAEEALARLRFGKKTAREIASLVKLHMVFYQDEWTDGAVRRLGARAGALLPRLLDLLEADSRALRRYAMNTRGVMLLRRRVEEVLGGAPPPVSPLAGRAIMAELGIGPGPEVGEAKEELARAAAEGEIARGSRAAREHLLRWWKGRGGRPAPPSPPSPRRRR
jgi:poly(A) polymerase